MSIDVLTHQIVGSLDTDGSTVFCHLKESCSHILPLCFVNNVSEYTGEDLYRNGNPKLS